MSGSDRRSRTSSPEAGIHGRCRRSPPRGEGVELHPKVTYLIGENGSGKSTLLEAIAVAAGMNPEGGSSNFAFTTRGSHSPILLAYPDAAIYACGEHGLERIDYEEAEPVRLTAAFLRDRDRFLIGLLSSDGEEDEWT